MDDAGGTLLLVGIIFLAVGAVQLGLGVFFLARTRRFLRTAVDTTGTIVDLLESHSSEGGTTFQAVVEFQTADGRTIQWTERMASNPPAGQSGDQVPMKYDPTDPDDARIAKTFRLWFLSGLLGLLGPLFFGIGVVLTVAGLAV
jgi:Protein of unknown function (DUF3592)